MTDMMALRRAWWQVHKWLALVLMVLLIPLGLSGAILAWDDAIDHALHPARFAVRGAAALPLAAYADAAKAALPPGARVAMVRLPDGAGPVVVNAVKGGGSRHDGAAPDERGRHDGGRHEHGGHEHHHGGNQAQGAPQPGGLPRGRPARLTVWLDPASARVLDAGPAQGGIVGFAHAFHGNLLVPGVGRALSGLLGVAMFLLAATGIWLWWPLRRGWTTGLRWRRGDARTSTNLHHMIGFWIALPLAAQAFTGAWIAWPQVAALVGLAHAERGPERGRFTPADEVSLTPDQAVAAARASAPDGTVQAVNWPTAAEPTWRVTLRGPRGRTEIAVDDASGAASPAPARAGGGGGVAMAMRHFHDGTTLGPVWRALMVLWGLAPTLLGITGLLMWWRGRGRRKRAAGRMRAPQPA